MRRVEKHFWGGFAAGVTAGAGLGAGALLVWQGLQHTHDDRIQRAESSLQIARPVEQVFRPLLHLNELPRYSSIINVVRSERDRSLWSVEYRGRKLRWEMQITEFKPNQAVAWKSLRGPKHDGRITFASVDGQTVISLRLNHAPRRFRLARWMAPAENLLQAAVEQAMRDYKAALESGAADAPAVAERHLPHAETGSAQTQRSRFGNAELAG